MNEGFSNESKSKAFKVNIDGQLLVIDKPNPTGRELLGKLGRDPESFFLVFRIAGEPDEVVELDEPFDLSAPGTEEFILVTRDRHFTIQIDESSYRVKGPLVLGQQLFDLVEKDPATHFLTQILVGVDDIVVGPEDRIDLSKPGVERFTVVAKPFDCEVIVNTRPRRVTTQTLSFDDVVRLAFDISADNANVAYTVTYRQGDPSKPQGSMVVGTSVKVRCGMIFDVDRTDRS